MDDEYAGMEHRLDIDLQHSRSDSRRSKVKSILVRGFEKWSQEKGFSLGNWKAVVVDVGQHKRSDPSISWFDAEDLDEHLRRARSIVDAKKRFQYVQIAHPIYFKLISRSFIQTLDIECALILFLATPRTERHQMAGFILRHSNYSSHLHEDVRLLIFLVSNIVFNKRSLLGPSFGRCMHDGASPQLLSTGQYGRETGYLYPRRLS